MRGTTQPGAEVPRTFWRSDLARDYFYRRRWRWELVSMLALLGSGLPVGHASRLARSGLNVIMVEGI
jgi:hypothetical protein